MKKIIILSIFMITILIIIIISCFDIEGEVNSEISYEQ